MLVQALFKPFLPQRLLANHYSNRNGSPRSLIDAPPIPS